MYAAYDRKPRLVDFDVSNAGSSYQDILEIVSKQLYHINNEIQFPSTDRIY